MNAALVALFARRLASPGALALVALVAFVTSDARSAWWFSIGIIALLATVRAAALPDAWLTGEGDWIGTAARPRALLLGAAWTGAALGTLLLAGAATLSIAFKTAWGEAGSTVLLEPASVGGPERSLVLMPGEIFEQPLGQEGAVGREVRVRSTATVGAAGPTTHALVEAGSSTKRISVARRTWLSLNLDPTATAVRVTNVGEGALAILGPLPVEIWAPSSALLGGHLRVGIYAGSFLVALVSVALMLGVVMGPGVAALLAFSLWLGVWMLGAGQGPGAGSDWMPGGPALGRALGAVRDGRSPLPVAGTNLGGAGAVLAVSWLLGSQLLRTWRDEVRG